MTVSRLPLYLAAAIMVSIFSTHDRPAVMLTHSFCGASLGVAAGIRILNKTFAQAGVSEVVCWQKSTETKRRK